MSIRINPRAKAYILRRLREPSTWAGFTAILTAFGIALSPEQSEAIALGGTAIAGLLAILVHESGETRAQDAERRQEPPVGPGDRSDADD